MRILTALVAILLISWTRGGAPVFVSERIGLGDIARDGCNVDIRGRLCAGANISGIANASTYQAVFSGNVYAPNIAALAANCCNGSSGGGGGGTVECSAGYYCADATCTTCIVCPPHTYSNGTLIGGCIPCDSSCDSCNPASGLCMVCARGKGMNLATFRDCTACTPGRSTQNTQNFCFPCLPGTYVGVSGAYECLPCEAGTFTNGTGKTFCFVCAAGTAALPGAASCFPCSQGSYTATTGNAVCALCPAGTFSSTFGRSTPCTACAVGKWSFPGLTACRNCAAGTYTNTTGNVVCERCAPGTWSSAGASVCV